MDLGLSGKVAIVTGGSQGIGYAAAEALAREGANVAICARDADRLEAAAAAIGESGGGEVRAIPCDVTDESAVTALVGRVVAEWGGVDILVNNAGTSSAGPFESVTDETWDADIGLKV